MKKSLLKIGNAIGSIAIVIYSLGYANGIISEVFLDPNKEIVVRPDKSCDQKSISSDEEETKE